MKGFIINGLRLGIVLNPGGLEVFVFVVVGFVVVGFVEVVL